jgi:hypothetical protein
VPRHRVLGIVALGAIAVAWALPMQSVGCGQNAHYAATRSFAEGRPSIDKYAAETCDIVRRGGHFYAAKGPALDFWSAPWYLLLRTLHAVPANRNAGASYPAAMLGVPLRAVWQIGLWAVVIPGVVLLLLVRRAADAIEPGTGVAAATVLGLATLVLPFSTLFFAHVPAAMLAFASFWLLFRRRSSLAAAAAGALAGLAIAVDLPLVVPAAALLVYAAVRRPRVRRGIAFAVGGLVGLLPLFAFDVWAFGSPFRIAYSGAAIDPGAAGVEQAHVHKLFFTLTAPHPRLAVEMLFSQRGLFVLSPVLAAGVAGLVLLWRRRLRAEAALIGSLCVAELIWLMFRPNYELALGGWVPGPRFLIPLLPFLCFALAPVLRRRPVTVGALAAISAAAMVVATSAEPLLQNDDTRHWLSRIVHGNFTATVVSLSGVGHGWLAILPFYALVLIAVAAAVAATPRLPVSRRDLWTAGAAVLAWVLVEHAAPELLRVDRLVHESWGVLAAIALIAAAAWAVIRLRPEGLLLLPFLTVHFDDHTKFALLLAVLVLAALAVHGRVRHPVGPA